ncbi:MAG: leucine-rich repeat protein [Eubacterium sp.]
MPFCTYEDDGNGGTNTHLEVEEELGDGVYNVRFYLGNDDTAYINIPFKKECQISYELNGGSFPEGLTFPKTISAGKFCALCSPVKEGSQFLGWKKKGESGDSYSRYVYWEGTDEAPTYVACWDDSTAPIDISEIDIDISETKFIFDEDEVTLKLEYIVSGDLLLEKNTNYFLSYRNNDKAATADSSNPPTVIIEGIGKYTGKVEKQFSISQSDKLYLPYYWDESYEGNFLYLDIVKGKPLSSIDLSDARVYKDREGNSEVKGTFSWEKGDYVPDAQVGDVLQNDSENTNYNLVFTPDNQDIYSRKVFTEGVEITVKQGSIADCQVTFASGKRSYLYTGEPIKPDVIVKDGENVLTEGTDYELSYAGYIKVAGSTDTYAPAVTIKGINSYIGTKKVTYTISMSPEPPVLTVVNETIKGKNDGSITGLTTDMEYRAALPSVGENTADFTPVKGTSMTLPAGAYEVRYKAEGIYDPSPVTTVVIQQGRALTLTLPAEQKGYTLTAADNELSWQGTTTLTLTLAPGYEKTSDFALEANVDFGDNQDGTYILSGVTKDVTVTVKGIATVTSPTASPTATVAPSPTASPTATVAPSPTASPTPSVAPTPTESPVVTVAPNPTESPVVTVAPNPTESPVVTVAPSPTPSPTPTVAPSPTPTIAPSPTASPTPIATPEPAPTAAPAQTASPSVIVDLTPTAIPSATVAPTPTASPVISETSSQMASPTASPFATVVPTPTATPMIEPTSTPENKQDVTTPSTGTKLKDEDKKAHYVIREDKEGAVKIQYVAPVKKTSKVTIPKTVTLENGTVAKVTSIAPNAFKNNTTLQQITIADTVTTIGKNAFSGCKKLKKISIGKKVTTIGSNAFKNCKNVKTIVITSKKLKNLSKSAFKGITSKTTIKVPASMYEAYKKLLRKSGLKSSVKIKKI